VEQAARINTDKAADAAWAGLMPAPRRRRSVDVMEDGFITVL
jgi:hypothetical protein